MKKAECSAVDCAEQRTRKTLIPKSERSRED